MVKFSKFCSASSIVKFVRREIDEIVRYLPHKNQNFDSLSKCHYCADRGQNLLGQHPTFGSQCSKFHQNRFTFGEVIAERLRPFFGP